MVRRIIQIYCFLIAATNLSGQNYSQLLEEKDKLIKESDKINALLEKTKFSKTNKLEELVILNKNISVQESLLTILNEEIVVLKNQEKEMSQKKKALANKMETIQIKYSSLLKKMHHLSVRYNRVLFFLGAENFNQLIRRMYYVKQIANEISRYHKEIESIKIEIKKRRDTIKTKRIKQSEVAFFKNKEIQELTDLRKNKNITLSILSQKQDSLLEVLSEKKIETKRITEAIMLILEKEKASNKNKSPELKLVSEEFESNKGRLPWPITTGATVSKFGMVPHPVLSGINTMNNGIEISTSDKYVRSVFDGEVTKIIVLPNGLRVVIIRHGEYLTVYSNLKEVNILKGETVSAKQAIGTLFEEDGITRQLLGFQIWKDRTKLNPTDWLSSY